MTHFAEDKFRIALQLSILYDSLFFVNRYKILFRFRHYSFRSRCSAASPILRKYLHRDYAPDYPTQLLAVAKIANVFTLAKFGRSGISLLMLLFWIRWPLISAT